VRNAYWVFPLTVFVMAGTFFAGGGAHGDLSPWQWVSVPLAGAATLALLLVRRSPQLTVLATGLLVGAYFSSGFHDGPVYLPVFFGSFLVARALPVRRWIPWVATAGGFVLVGMAIRAVTSGLGWWQPTGQAIATSALIVAAAAIGSLVRSRQLTEAERVARVATEEQLRMAQDLHDGVGHGLAVIAMQAGVALHVLDRDPAAARAALEAIRDTSRDSLDSLRAELSQLAGDPARRAPRRGLADLTELAARVQAAGLRISREGRTSVDHPRPLPDAVDEAAYAIVQEALTNVLRHAAATSVVLRLDRYDDTLAVAVRDDGRGGAVHDEGMGITGMRHRAESVGGTLTVGPRAGGGFEVTAELPL